MTTDTLANVRKSALAALMPPPKRRLSDWIEETIMLPDDVSALPGSVRLWPFQRDIADAIGDPLIERVTLVKPVRVGFTTLLTGALAGYIANDPSPILCLLPTEADCRDYMVSDIEPIFNASPDLIGLLARGGSDGERNTLMARRFPGGSLKVVAAKAPRNLRRHNVRVLLCDEVDGMENGAEGSPILLAERRTLSFADRKIVIGSTPVYANTSHVLRSYEQSDKRVFEVPCPECGGFHEIQWKDIQWPEGEPERAAYHCPSCGCEIEERWKPQMVSDGRWRATQPEVTDHAGFRLNALVSLLANASWAKLAKEFLAAKDDPALLQVFTNTILAEGWNEAGEELDENDLYSRREAFGLEPVPQEALALTAGVDVQRDRLEISFLGWTEAGECLVLGHRVIWGSPHDEETWAELESLLSTRWPHALGGRMGLDAAVVDSGDGETMERVYAFCFPRYRRKIVAGKGVAGNRQWIERSKTKRGGNLFLVGVDGLKAHIVARLARGRTIRFANDLPPVWFEQLASERLVVRYSRGQPSRRFERIPGRAAEALDCVVYGFAARQLVNVNWLQRADDLRHDQPQTRQEEQRVVRSRWLR
ncbi:phage terminase large subunit family protein [Martelella sp. AD-3]|uniref:phage terminase large subunit family protein n=1 Tax=Martelella sp. AD-3 TaxID=686597 RepID=UPI0004658144|nr:phage terminase large subunit family protein [Martelella sp. AD-3]AMM83983.1 terminase [Martelella sp. AD-3]